MSKLYHWLKKHDLVFYFVLAFAISWSVEIPLAIRAQSQPERPTVPFALHYLISYGPMLAAILVTGFTRGREGLNQLWARVVQWRVRPIYWLAAVSPLILLIITLPVWSVIQQQWPDLTQLGDVPFLPNLGLAALPLWILTSGLGEEIGWRGYALPRLQRRYSALTATLFLSVLWGLWHVPLFFYMEQPSIDTLVGNAPQFSYLSQPLMNAFWFLGLVAGAIVFTWLLNSSQGSILMVILFHGAYNFVTASVTANGIPAAIVSTLVMLWSVIVIFVFKPRTLAHAAKWETPQVALSKTG
ncbi:MAG TPA: type II CAAX endopeptidase family protein [Phototrophicaceae bacterium]|nr:type II CAAX endopeptidase family protein [Phototrophicaceae bacterium]